MKPLLNSKTDLALQNFIAKPGHALMLVGGTGTGKTHLATYLAAELLNTFVVKLEKHVGFRVIADQNGRLGIEQIRELQNFLKLKSPSSQGINRVCLISNTQNMTIEAQNALLKTLEEPPADTVILLTAIPSLKISSTIYSRSQRINIMPPTLEDTVSYFEAQNYSSEEITKAYKISAGMIGLTSTILGNDQENTILQNIETAKQLLRQSKYERLIKTDGLLKNKELLGLLLFALKRILQSALDQAVSKQSPNIPRLVKSLKVVQETELALSKNASPKLAIDNLLLNI